MLCVYLGLVMLAYFVDRGDPIDAGDITSKDQLVVLFATRVLKIIPGFPGLFLACIVGSTLSTVSSGINSMAAVTWEDFIKGTEFGRNLSDGRAVLLNKALVLGFGVAATCMSFAAGPLGGLIRASLSGIGAVSGPVIGVFVLGLFVPAGNKYGAITGLVVSSSVTLWLLVGGFATKPYGRYKMVVNASHFADNDDYALHYGDLSVWYPYRVSEYLYPFIGLVLSVVVGTVVSYATKNRFECQPVPCLTYYGRNLSYDVMELKAENKLKMESKGSSEKNRASKHVVGKDYERTKL